MSLSNQLNPSSGHDLVFGKYGEYLPECGPGEYLNLCGECVSGKTEKEDGFGKDSCGICGGLETCEVQCSDPMDILDEDEKPNGCLKFISMSPSLLDIAESTSGSVCIFGDGITAETVVDCSISKDDESMMPIKTQVLENKIELTFPLSGKEGNYDLHCNTSTAVEFMETLLVVDTNSLLPTAVDSPALITWKENQVTVTVSKMSGPVDVLCFAKTSSDDLLFSEWTSEVEGNSLSSTVKCPPFVPVRPQQLEFGVAYSIKGTKTAKMIKVATVTEPPKPVSAIFVKGTSKISVTLDQNLEEGTEDCSTLFDSETVLLFGNPSLCKILVNEVHVLLARSVSIPNTTLNFKDGAVKTRFSESAGGGSVKVISVETVKDGDIAGSGLECQEGLKLQAAGSLPVAANSNRSDIPIGQRQRLNLLAWRAARASTPAPKAKSNATEMKTSVEKNSDDSAIEATSTIARHNSDQVWLQLHGPSSVEVMAHTVFMATVHSCGPGLNPSKFKWSVTSDQDKLDTYFANGPKLKLPPGSFLPNSKYKISVQAMEGEEQIATLTTEVETYIQNFKIHLQDTELIVGNADAIDIDGSKFLDLDPKAIKLSWTCKKGFCYLPGKDKIPLDSLEAFTHPHLLLPAKTLAVGRYLFALEASSGGIKLDEVEVEIAVVSGQPPYISTLNIKEDETSYHFQAQVSEIRQRCQLFWSVIPRVTFSYINISQDPIVVEGLPTRSQNFQMSLAINKNSLIPGTKLLLRVTADCARAGYIYRQFRFFVPDSLNRYQLEVEPKVGKALQTEFVFRLVEKQTSGKAIYSYGYEENGIPNILCTGFDKVFKTYLGCCKYKSFAMLCETKLNCITIYGPEIETTLPSTFNGSISRSLVSSYKELVMSSDYEEALANLKMVVPALEKVDSDAHKQYCHEAEEVILERITAHANRLQKDKDYLHESVRVLDAASNLMATIRLSEESLNTILQFRDLVHANTRSLSEKIKEKKISQNLPSEPRIGSNNIDTMIAMKHKISENLKKKSFEAAEAALKSKIELLKKFDNDLSDHKERALLLNSILYTSLRHGTKSDSLGPVLYNTTENLVLQKREVGDMKTKTISKKDMETVLKATVLPLLQKDGNWTKAREETLKLISIIFDYSKDLCNDASAPHIIGAEKDLVLLGSVPLKSANKEKVKFPFCSSWCPPVKDLLNVSLSNINSGSNSSEGVCLSIASFRDDILTNLILPATVNSTGVRRSAVYWLDALKYQHGVVPGILYNITYDSESSGHMVVQFPVLPDPKISSKKSKLECWMFSAGGWNNTACVKMKEIPKQNITSLQCNCSFPGFYSVFSVEDTKLNEESVTTKTEIASTSTKFVSVTTAKPGPATLITTTTPMPTVSTLQTTTNVLNISEKQETIKTSVTLKVPVTPTTPKNLSTTLPTIQSTTTMVAQNVSSIKTTTPTTKPITSTVTQAYDNDIRTVPSIYQPYKYSATFRINESYAHEVGEMKEKFEELVEDQLQKILNMSDSVTVVAWQEKEKIVIALRIPENKLQEAGYSITLLKDLLKNGTLILNGLNKNRLDIPAQDIVLTQKGGAAKSAITAFVTIVFIFLMILIGSVVAAFYLRNNREQRSIRITQDLHSDPPAPKYLRLHDSVSLDSSGPSTPQNMEMESSLAVLTRPQRRGYETMETFSHFPGNI